MPEQHLHLTIVSQERQLLSQQVDAVSAPTSEGEITILPGHIPLMSKLDYGELRYQEGNDWHSIVISKGFINVEPSNQITVMVDAAKHARELSEEKAEEAIKHAQETMATSTDRQELIMAEASLKQALWEVKIARKTRKSQI
jgi:F-type H+-transporting ATPase subunit epsilon